MKQSEALYSYTQKHDYGSKNEVVKMQSLLPLTAFLLLHFYSFFVWMSRESSRQRRCILTLRSMDMAGTRYAYLRAHTQVV
jgi:hypothetical protein